MDVKENSYIGIQAFMVNDLHLSGNELIIFAVIFGFSQDGESWFRGSRGYLSTWCQASKTTVSNNLAKLCEKGLIEKRTRIESGVTFNDYRVCKKFIGGVQESCRGGVQEIVTHNIDTETKAETIETRGMSVNAQIIEFTQDETLRASLNDFIRARKQSGKPVSNEGMKRLLNSLKSLSDDTATQTAIVEQSIMNGWRGFFELKNGGKVKPVHEQDHSLDDIFHAVSRG